MLIFFFKPQQKRHLPQHLQPLLAFRGVVGAVDQSPGPRVSVSGVVFCVRGRLSMIASLHVDKGARLLLATRLTKGVHLGVGLLDLKNIFGHFWACRTYLILSPYAAAVRGACANDSLCMTH